MAPSPHTWFRHTLTILAAALGALAIWILAAELCRPGSPAGTAIEEGSGSTRQTDAERAARLGSLRGDLWAEYAFSLAGPPGGSSSNLGPTLPDQAEPRVWAAAERAASLSPHASAIWLLLARSATQLNRADANTVELLKMSYYTGPNELALIPRRILVTVRSKAIDDPEIRQLARHDILAIVSRHPAAKPGIFAAHRDAPAAGRQFIEATVGELDPSLLASLRSGSPRP